MAAPALTEAGTQAPRTTRATTVPAVLVAGVVVAQIAYPLVTGDARAALTVATVGLFFAACCTHSLATRGVGWTARWVAVSGGTGLLVEALGTRTGVPFGSYGYSDTLGPALLGVPVVIPLAWAMMAYPALLLARRVTRHRARQALLAGWALAAWDVFLDPQMVAEGYWRWTASGPAFAGIPAVNFAGWLVTATVMMTVLSAVLPDGPDGPDGPDAVPLALYLWTYAGSVLANIAFFGRPLVGLVGGIVMGVPVALLLRTLRCGPP